MTMKLNPNLSEKQFHQSLKILNVISLDFIAGLLYLF